MKSPADMKIIQIEITNACPRKCANCTRFCGHHTEPFFMDFETFKQAVDSLKGFRGIIGIMGGEPTIHPEFERFVRYFRENVGFDDLSTVATKPQADFMRHVLANQYHVDYHNHRGLWTSITPRYYEHFELIQDTFGYQLLNDHTNPSAHQTLMVTRKELGIPDDEWIKMRDACWVQNLWSASITPKGAFFCEIAAAMDATLGGPGGWQVEPGWWKRKPEDFKEQLDWCEMCSACLPMPSRDANDETDDVSPIWAEKLKEIKSPKFRKGLVNTFDPLAYQADKYSINQNPTPYLDDEESRMGKSRGRLVPQKMTHVVWLSDEITPIQARLLVFQLREKGQVDALAGATPEHRALAEEIGAPFLSGERAFADLIETVKARDWVVMTRDCAPPDSFLDLTTKCVFNPGVVYSRKYEDFFLQFFNVRAMALRQGGDLFDIAASYPPRKALDLPTDDVANYALSDGKMFSQRLLKRFNWGIRWLTGRPVTRGPIGELAGNKIETSL